MPLQVLKLLEAETGKKIHQLFDYICGVSTGDQLQNPELLKITTLCILHASQSESLIPCLTCTSLHLFVKGAVLAFMLGLAHFSLEECADMYRRFGSEVFRQNPLVGTVKMGWSHSYYNTETWEAILQ